MSTRRTITLYDLEEREGIWTDAGEGLPAAGTLDPEVEGSPDAQSAPKHDQPVPVPACDA
jgi:hypothetical protein